MHLTSIVLGLAVVGSAWLSLMLSGCGGPPVQQPGANGTWAPSQLQTNIGERQLDSLLVMVSQLQMVAQASLDAATLVGTPSHELTAAGQDYASAELLLHDGQAAYMAKQYDRSRDRLYAAEAAFRRTDEAAVHAGLGQLEHALAADYGRLLNPDAGSGRRRMGIARASQGSINLRYGAGTHFQEIGMVQSGDTLTILAELEGWYQVRTGTGLVGWVSKILVTEVQSSKG